MEVVAQPGSFGPRTTQKRGVGRPKHYTAGKHELHSASIMRIEGFEERLKEAEGNAEMLQALLESVHSEKHIYWVSGVSDGDPWEMRVGPVILPFYSRAYVFYIEVERRKSDDAPPKNAVWGRTLKDAPTDAPRRVFPGSFILQTRYTSEQLKHQPNAPVSREFVAMWPPNLYACLEMVDSSIPLKPRGLHKLYWRASDHYKARSPTAVCRSIADVEHDAHGLSLEVKTSLMLSLREFMLGPEFFEMCRYFEAKDLVRMPSFFFRKFCTDLPKHSDAILMAFLRNPRCGRRFVDGSSFVRFIDEKISNVVFIDYLLPDFADRNGWMALSQKRAADEERDRLTRTRAEEAREALKSSSGAAHHPSLAAKTGGKRKGISVSLDSFKTGPSVARESPVSPRAKGGDQSATAAAAAAAAAKRLKAKSPTAAIMLAQQRHIASLRKERLVSDCGGEETDDATASLAVGSALAYVADPSSKLQIANWFDTMRAVYYQILGAEYLEKGAMYVEYAFSEQELEYAQYLVDKRIIKAYSGFKQRGAPFIARHWTSADCGVEVDTLVPHRAYYIHPFLDSHSMLQTVRNIINSLWASYETGMQNYTRQMVKNALFEVGISTHTYYEEYVLTRQAYVQQMKMRLSDEESERLRRVHERLTVIARRERAHLEAHETNFLLSHQWPHNQREILKEELLSRDAVPESEGRFWSELRLLTTHSGRQYAYARDAFLRRYDVWMRIKGAGMNLSERVKDEVRDMLAAYLRLPVVIFDLPETNIGERRTEERNAPDVFRAMIRDIADMSFGPAEIRTAALTTQESLLFKRSVVFPDASRKLVCLHELEKWTVQDLQEVLSACFFDWDGQASMNPPSTSHVLWIFADRNAIDLGALSALVQMSRIKESGLSPLAESSFVDLRSRCVKESETAGLAVRLLKDEIYSSSAIEDAIDCVKECLYVSEFDEQSVQVYVEVEPTGELYSVATARLAHISMKDLPALRYGTSKPDYAKVNLMELDNWRQIYTLMCYVRCALLLVGPRQTLEVLLKASRQELLFTEYDVGEGAQALSEEERAARLARYAHPSASDVTREPASGAWGRVLYRPTEPLDLFTSIANYVVPDPPKVVTAHDVRTGHHNHHQHMSDI